MRRAPELKMDMRELELDLRRAFAKQGMTLYKDDGMFVWRDDYADRFMVFFGPYQARLANAEV